MHTEVNYLDGIAFFAVPIVRKNATPCLQRRCQRRRSLWLAKLGKMDQMHSEKPLKVCSRHFISGKCLFGVERKMCVPGE